MATLERFSPRAPTAAFLLALQAGVSLTLALASLIPGLLGLGSPETATASLLGNVVGLLGSAVLLTGSLLSRRGLPSGPLLARWSAIGMFYYSLASVAVGEYLLKTGRVGTTAALNPRAAYAGLLGAMVAGLLWWGAAWLLARRL